MVKIALIGDSLTEGRPGIPFHNILKEKYPSITFINLGASGETVKSLYSRLSKLTLGSNYDLAFLWIGVNDIYSKLLKVQAQPVAENLQEFSEYYIKVLNVVISSSKYVVLVSPAIIGENIRNSSNDELKDLSASIQSISNQHPNVRFLNMHSVFEEQLAKVHSSDYISTSVFRVMKDVLFYKKPSRIDRLSSKRGLHLTLDGIHLNSNGALTVADKYSSLIDQILFDRNATVHD